MPRSPAITAFVIVACAALCACAHARTISSAELRAEIDLYTCAYWEPEVQAWGVLFLDVSCPRPPATTPLARAVAAAVLEVRSLPFITTAYEQLDAALTTTPSPTRQTTDTVARATVWRDPVLAPAVLGRAIAQLPAQHLRCEDCRTPPSPAPREVSWDVFFPYLAAFIWPVQDAHGQVDIYTCSAINGAASLPADPRLVHAARLAALDFVLDETHAPQLTEIKHGPVSRSVTDVAREISALLHAPAGRAHVCASLARHRWFTGLTVEPC